MKTQELNPGHYTEIIDRINIVSNLVNGLLIEHPVAKNNIKLRALLFRADELLNEAYQLVGSFSVEIVSNPDEIKNVDCEPRFLYSIKDAAKYFKVSSVTFQKWKNEGYFTFTQIGRKCIFDIQLIKSELKTYKKRK